MENWTVYCDYTYEATPWPFRKTWEEFMQAPEPLVHPNADFGRCSASDAIHESPVAPPFLPRALPQGQYQMAIYHDAKFLYAFLHAGDGPVATPLEVLHRIPHLNKMRASYPALALLSTDQRLDYRFGVDRQGAKNLRVSANAYGPRRREPIAPQLEWDVIIVSQPAGELTGWRIARAGLTDMLDGNRLQFSISRQQIETMESVAWAAHNGWGARPDEMGTVKLVEQRSVPAWPRVRRVDLAYEPATERGRFQVYWNAPYGDAYTGLNINFTATTKFLPAWDKFTFRLNQRLETLNLAEQAETGEFSIADGDNRVEIAPVCAPLHLFFFEKRSGNRIAETPQPAQLRSADWINQRLRTDCEDAVRWNADRRAQGDQRQFLAWEAYRASSLGRVYRYLVPDERLLGIVRDVADFTIKMQREDGTFAGLHMQQHGSKPAPWAGGAYDTGPVGELWAVAYALTKDEKYLTASQRLLTAYDLYRVELNHNYAAFTLYHLAAHYRITRDPRALEQALYYAKHCAATDILPLGFHRGHNYYCCYGNITLRGLAMLCAVLPETEPYRATLRELCVRMTNQVIARQQPDGRFDARVRYWLGRTDWMWGMFPAGFLLDRADAARFDAVVQRMLWAVLEVAEFSGAERLGQCDFALYYAHRDKLLAGEKIDFLTLV